MISFSSSGAAARAVTAAEAARNWRRFMMRSPGTAACRSGRHSTHLDAALRLSKSHTAPRRSAHLDAALDLAVRNGWSHIELPRAAVLPADPETVKFLAGLVRRLFDRGPEVRCERQPNLVRLRPEKVA